MNILITGANRGLGLALCKIFLELAHRVFALYRSKGETLEKLANAYPFSETAGLIPIQCDVTDEAQLCTAFNRIQAISPSLDILINNAEVHLEQNKPDLDELNFPYTPQSLRLTRWHPS